LQVASTAALAARCHANGWCTGPTTGVPHSICTAKREVRRGYAAMLHEAVLHVRSSGRGCVVVHRARRMVHAKQQPHLPSKYFLPCFQAGAAQQQVTVMIQCYMQDICDRYSASASVAHLWYEPFVRNTSSSDSASVDKLKGPTMLTEMLGQCHSPMSCSMPCARAHS
jgi:hypothetical protein